MFLGKLPTLPIRRAQRGECFPLLQKHMEALTLETMNVIFSGKRRKPNSNDMCPFKREGDRDSSHRDIQRLYEDRDRE